jgi:hypothetical protein
MQSGTSLKELRAPLGITVREVEEQSQKIAKAQGNPEFFVSNHCLTKLENTDRAHPVSSQPRRRFSVREAEIVGQVTAIATRIVDLDPGDGRHKPRTQLSKRF